LLKAVLISFIFILPTSQLHGLYCDASHIKSSDIEYLIPTDNSVIGTLNYWFLLTWFGSTRTRVITNLLCTFFYISSSSFQLSAISVNRSIPHFFKYIVYFSYMLRNFLHFPILHPAEVSTGHSF